MTEFMMVSNLRIQATMTTFPGFPVALRREAKALMSGLQRMAVSMNAPCTPRHCAATGWLFCKGWRPAAR